MTSTRLVVAVAAFVAVSGFTDQDKKYTIDFPGGWRTSVVDQGEHTVEAIGAAGKPNGFCRANSIALASLKDTTPAALNAQFGQKPLDKETWAALMTVDAAKFEVSEGAVKIVNNHPVHSATFIFDASVLGQLTKARWTSHIMTGRVVNGACFAPVGAFDGLRPAFDKVVASLKPL